MDPFCDVSHGARLIQDVSTSFFRHHFIRNVGVVTSNNTYMCPVVSRILWLRLYCNSFIATCCNMVTMDTSVVYSRYCLLIPQLKLLCLSSMANMQMSNCMVEDSTFLRIHSSQCSMYICISMRFTFTVLLPAFSRGSNVSRFYCTTSVHLHTLYVIGVIIASCVSKVFSSSNADLYREERSTQRCALHHSDAEVLLLLTTDDLWRPVWKDRHWYCFLAVTDILLEPSCAWNWGLDILIVRLLVLSSPSDYYHSGLRSNPLTPTVVIYGYSYKASCVRPG